MSQGPGIIPTIATIMFTLSSVMVAVVVFMLNLGLALFDQQRDLEAEAERLTRWVEWAFGQIFRFGNSPIQRNYPIVFPPMNDLIDRLLVSSQLSQRLGTLVGRMRRIIYWRNTITCLLALNMTIGISAVTGFYLGTGYDLVFVLFYYAAWISMGAIITFFALEGGPW